MKAVFELAEKYYPTYWSKERLDALLAKKKLTQEECCKIFLDRLIYLCSCFFQLYNDD